jgi:hypothetical protein
MAEVERLEKEFCTKRQIFRRVIIQIIVMIDKDHLTKAGKWYDFHGFTHRFRQGKSTRKLISVTADKW